MDINNDTSSDDLISKPGPLRPVVLVLIDAWGIAPKYSGNVFADLKIKNFSSLIKDYPLALLSVPLDNAAKRYSLIGASGDLSLAISQAGLSQLNLTESEKLINSWHHFNSGRTELLAKEDLKVISSKTGARNLDYKQSLPEIVKLALADIKKETHDVLILNLANLDLVSATGDLLASKLAAKELDKSLGRLADAVLKQDGVMIVGAAYGHAESMINMATELPQSGITNNPVPLIIISRHYQGKNIGLSDTLDDDLSLVEPVGTLADISPTILKILNIPPPSKLPGESLI